MHARSTVDADLAAPCPAWAEAPEEAASHAKKWEAVCDEHENDTTASGAAQTPHAQSVGHARARAPSSNADVGPSQAPTLQL